MKDRDRTPGNYNHVQQLATALRHMGDAGDRLAREFLAQAHQEARQATVEPVPTTDHVPVDCLPSRHVLAFSTRPTSPVLNGRPLLDPAHCALFQEILLLTGEQAKYAHAR